MVLVVGGVTHDPIKARRRFGQARAASAITVARRRCIHRRRHRHRQRPCRHCRSSLSSPLPNATVAFSASAITAAAATAAVAVAVAAATISDYLAEKKSLQKQNKNFDGHITTI